MKLTVYSADCVGSLSNCVYPNKHIITDETTMKNPAFLFFDQNKPVQH